MILTDALAWEEASDLIVGLRAYTAGDRNVRPEHWKWHRQLYKRDAAGLYRHPELGLLPEFPAGPNCRCWTVAELLPSLTKGAKAANYGAYDTARRRFRRQEAGVN